MRPNRVLFLSATIILVAAIIVASAITLAKGPRETCVELVGTDGSTAQVNDYHDGKMTIPYYNNVAASQYKPSDFFEEDGVVKYRGEYTRGINVSDQMGDIDWQQVKDSGVDYAMIRVGFRGKMLGLINPDTKFKQNIEGAMEAGLPVGVYFFSQAVTDAEADDEAAFVLEQIRGKSMKYPVAIYWKYATKDDGSQDENARTTRCNGEQITGFIDTFCNKINGAGFTPCYYAGKDMAYNKLNLSRLANYTLWYAEYKPVPSFYYEYKMWQYTEEAEVPGISGKVPVTLSLK